MPEESNTLNRLIIGTVLTGLVSAAGYSGKLFFIDPYLEEKNQQEKKQKELFEQNNNEFEKIYKIYNKTYTFYENGFAFTNEELKPLLDEWLETKESYEINLREIERFGNSDEIYAAKQTYSFIDNIVSILKINLEASNYPKQSIAFFSKIDLNDNNQFQEVAELMTSSLDLLINLENRTYYELRYNKSIFDGLKKYSDFQYKNTLQYPEAQTNLDTIKKSINLYNNRPQETIYKDSKFPYIIAQKRANHSLKESEFSDNKYAQNQNERIKLDVAKKFIANYSSKSNEVNLTQ